MPLKQSFCYPCFTNDEIGFEAICAAAASVGYPAVEWWFRDEQFAERVAIAKQHGLVVASICGHGSIDSGLNDPNEHDRIETELRESMDLAAQHGIPNLICFGGRRREGQSDAEAIEVCAAGLRRVTPQAERIGVNLNMELLNSKIDHAGYQCDRTAWGIAVCQAVGSPRAKLLYDIYHMQIMEGDIIRTIQENIQWIGHFHTAGNPGRHDLDENQELNYAAICRAIAETGYDLFIGHEFFPQGDKLQALRRTFELCSQQ